MTRAETTERLSRMAEARNPMNYEVDKGPELSVRSAMDGCELHQPRVRRTITCPACGTSISVGVLVTGVEARP